MGRLLIGQKLIMMPFYCHGLKDDTCYVTQRLKLSNLLSETAKPTSYIK